MRKLLLALCMVSVTAAANSAHADQRCRQVQITVSNETGQTIRIFRMTYDDMEDAMRRTNDIPNADVLNGGTTTVSETLEYVGNEAIGLVSIQYRIGSGPRQWSDPAPSGIDRCNRFDQIFHLIE